MRFHTSLTLADVRSVELPPGVHWHHVSEYGSRSRARAIEIVLEGNSCYGGQWGDRDYKAGTWDEWGVVLGRLFALDPNARVAKVYEGAEHYHYVTGDRFRPDRLPERLCPRHKWTFVDYCRSTCEGMSECSKCDALKRWGPPPPPEPRDDTARVARTEAPAPGPRTWSGSPADFLAGRRTPAESYTYGQRDERYSGPYKGGRNYAAEFEADRGDVPEPVSLLDKIDALIGGE